MGGFINDRFVLPQYELTNGVLSYIKPGNKPGARKDKFPDAGTVLLYLSNKKGDTMHWTSFVYGLPKRENPQEMQEVAAEISGLKEERDAIRAEKDIAEMEAEISGLKEERDAIRAEKDAAEKEIMQLRAFTDQLKAEQRNGSADAPYMVLLDEANLSPIFTGTG